jgi:uncharacterized ion transporter superfamily protein YfcC
MEPKPTVAPKPGIVWPLVSAVLVGLAIAWLDNQQGWDDTGVTAGLVLVAAGSFSALRPTYAWLWALAIGLWIPLVGIVSSQNYESLVALAVAFLGAYSGALLAKVARLFR